MVIKGKIKFLSGIINENQYSKMNAVIESGRDECIIEFRGTKMLLRMRDYYIGSTVQVGYRASVNENVQSNIAIAIKKI